MSDILELTDDGEKITAEDIGLVAKECGCREGLDVCELCCECLKGDESQEIDKFYDSDLKAVDDEEGTFTATITTGAIDRDKEVIVAKGINFENFLKNPVVMFGHDHHSLPIGKAMWVKSARGGKIVAKVKVAPTEFAQEVFDLIKGGFLGAVSIGFAARSEKNGPPKTEEIKKNPEWAEARWVFRESELLEFSVVNVPANPEALITAVGKGVMSLSKEMSELLDVADVPVDIVEGHMFDAGKVPPVQFTVSQPKQFTTEPILTEQRVKAILDKRLLHAKGRMVSL